MGSDEERLEEMLKAVMEAESEKISVPEIPEDDFADMPHDEIPEIPMEDFADISMEEAPELQMEEYADIPQHELPEIPMEDFADIPQHEIPEIPTDDLAEIPEIPTDDFADISLEEVPEIQADDFADMPPHETPNAAEENLTMSSTDEVPEQPPRQTSRPQADEMRINPLELLAMSEAEIDKVLEEEAALGEMFSRKTEGGVESNLSEERDDLSDIQELLRMSDNHEQVADSKAVKNVFPESTSMAGRDVQSPSEISGTEEEESEDLKKKQAKEDDKKKKKEERKKEKERKKEERKKEREKKEDNGEKKEGFGKKFAAFFFGSDDDLEDEKIESGKQKEEGADVKEKKKKEKKKKEKKAPKKNEPDPKKAAKEKLQREKKAEKAKKKAEKAEIAAKEKRAAKKLPKKKVIVWVLFCASIGAGILLINSIGIATIQLTEARNAFEDKDFKTVYKLLNGRNLSEEDQLIFRQSSAVLHLNHALEAYENHLKLEKPVMALEDLLKGIDKYQKLMQADENDVITPELTAEYQNILYILREQYALSEEGALELNALDSDYEYSLQLEAVVNGEVYQSQEELEQQQEEEAVQYPELEDMLPEEEEFFNDSSD